MRYRNILTHHQFRYLGAFYLHSTTRLFAVSIFHIFNGIYIYQTLLNFGFSIQRSLSVTALIFALTFLVLALSIAPTLWLISKKGLRFSTLLGSITLIICLLLLYLAKYDPFFFIISGILTGLQLAFYWMAYHIYFAKLTDDKKQGEELSISGSLAAVAAIGGPAFGGLIITYAGYSGVFLATGILMLISMVPLKYIPKDKDTIKIDILKTVFALGPKREEKSYLALLGIGSNETTNNIFWPIFALPILTTIAGIGFLASIVALFAALTTLITGFLIDKFGAKKIIKYASSIESISSTLKALALTPMHVFLTSITTGIFGEAQTLSLDSSIYQRARHQDLIAFITQREFALSVGRFIYLVILGILFWFGLPLMAIFVISAALTLLTRFYPYLGSNDN